MFNLNYVIAVFPLVIEDQCISGGAGQGPVGGGRGDVHPFHVAIVVDSPRS